MQHRRRGYDEVHQVCNDEEVGKLLNINALVYADDRCLSMVAMPTTLSIVAMTVNWLVSDAYI